jgi:hypothetical protein
MEASLAGEIASREFGKAAGLEADGLGFADRFGFVVDESEIVDGAVAGIELTEGTLMEAGGDIGICVPAPTDGMETGFVAVFGLGIGVGSADDGIPDDGTAVIGELFWFGIGVGDCVGLVMGIEEWE